MSMRAIGGRSLRSAIAADTVRELYAALGRGDVAGFLALLDPSVIWTVPGRHSLAGTWTGVESVMGHLAEVAQRTGGQIALDVVEVLSGGSRAAALVDVSLSIDGRTAQDRQVHLVEVRDGLVVSLREYHGDEEAMARLVDG
jgi:ketosteroid isomerase-like protein